MPWALRPSPIPNFIIRVIMAFWTTALLVLVWRYIHDGRDHYLYLASAGLAFIFATKETAYFVVSSLAH